MIETSNSRWPVRERDGKWQVLYGPGSQGEEWVTCLNQDMALAMAETPELAEALHIYDRESVIQQSQHQELRDRIFRTAKVLRMCRTCFAARMIISIADEIIDAAT